jgi:hypothetical protein
MKLSSAWLGCYFSSLNKNFISVSRSLVIDSYKYLIMKPVS